MIKFWKEYGGIITAAVITSIFLFAMLQLSEIVREVRIEEAPK